MPETKIDIGAVVSRWWYVLQPDVAFDGSDAPATLARLRRAPTPDAAYRERAVVLLHESLGGKPYHYKRVAAIGAVLAHVRSNDGEGVVQRIATGRGDRPMVSALRFKRLLEVEDEVGMMVHFRHFVALMDGTCNVRDLATSMWDWTDQVRRNGRLRRWLYAYHTQTKD